MTQDTTFDLVEMVLNVSRIMKQEMSFSNSLTHLSVLQIQTLMFLSQNKELAMSDVAGYFHIELPSATSLMAKLCDQGLVKRYEDLKDRRLVCVELTVEGKRLLEQVKTDHRKKLEKMLSYLSDREKSELMNILKTFYVKFQK